MIFFKTKTKHQIVIPFILLMLLIVTACSSADESGKVKVNLKSKIVINDETRSTLNTIDSYQVLFKKIEIGNSENDKFTLWEKEDGQLKDVVNEVSFDGETEVKIGEYNYVRLTLGEKLEVAGSVDSNGTIYYGTGSHILDNITHLWGTDIENWEGEITLQNPIKIEDNSTLTFIFDITGTVDYQSGPADNAVLGVQKPVLTIDIE